MKHMKKIMAILTALATVATLASCAWADPPESEAVQTTTPSAILDTTTKPEINETTTGYGDHCTTSDPTLPAIVESVSFLSNGESYQPYQELVYFRDGSVVGDGYLILMSVSSRLKSIMNDIPTVPFSDNASFEILTNDGIAVHGGETVDVYDETATLLAKDMTLSEVWEKGQNEWDNMAVYLYAEISFTLLGAGDYPKSTCNGYFVRVSFADLIAAPMEYSVMVYTDGAEQEPYSSLIYIKDYHDFGDGTGSPFVADGALMFMQVSDLLPTYAAFIPEMTLTADAEVRLSARAGVDMRGGNTFEVYDADFVQIGDEMTLSAILEKGEGEWRGKTVYLYFWATFTAPINHQHEKVVSNGYFLKTMCP